MQGSEPWFVAKDVCDILGLSNSRDALESLDNDEKITVDNAYSNPRAGIPHTISIVSESGLYSLVMRSRKPEAKKFRRWVTHEVLPSIFRTGAYIPPIVAERMAAAKKHLAETETMVAGLMSQLITAMVQEREANATARWIERNPRPDADPNAPPTWDEPVPFPPEPEEPAPAKTQAWIGPEPTQWPKTTAEAAATLTREAGYMVSIRQVHRVLRLRGLIRKIGKHYRMTDTGIKTGWLCERKYASSSNWRVMVTEAGYLPLCKIFLGR
jgi:Prophage antirepressor